MKRVLVVGMTASIHTARGTQAVLEHGWDVALFPDSDVTGNDALAGVTLYRPRSDRSGIGLSNARVVGAPRIPRYGPTALWRAASLASVIRSLRPHLIHAQDIQHGGQLAVRAVSMLPDPPPLLLSMWGSDLNLRWRLPADLARIRRTLRGVDVLTADCEQALRLARQLGFKGEIARAMPIGGGFDLDAVAGLKSGTRPSTRGTVVIKGYQHWAGRAQVALRAIELCGNALAGLQLAVYAIGPDEEVLARRVARNARMDLQVVSRLGDWVSHEEILRLQGRARVSVGLSISDGISNAVLESMIMGSLPVQSGTGCADEWVEDGTSALIIPAEDPEAAAKAILRAVTDDQLVDRAAQINAETARLRLAYPVLAEQLAALYERTSARRRGD